MGGKGNVWYKDYRERRRVLVKAFEELRLRNLKARERKLAGLAMCFLAEKLEWLDIGGGGLAGVGDTSLSSICVAGDSGGEVDRGEEDPFTMSTW